MTAANGRGDTVYGMTLVAVSVAMLFFGCVVLLLGRHDVGMARAELSRAVSAAAAKDHLSPRDPLILRDVTKRLPASIRLIPMPDFARSGRLLIVSRRMHHDRARVCVVLPQDARQRITDCPSS